MYPKIDVGLLTWHYYSNAGGMLQAYALFRVIKQAGYSVRFINYRPLSIFGWLRKQVKEICVFVEHLAVPFSLPQYLQFPAYRFSKEFFEQTKLYITNKHLGDLNGQFKMYLCGSDQIWAPNVLDMTYLLSFADEKTPKYSYGASIGLPDIPEEKKSLYRYYLQRFKKITVREEQGAQLLQILLNRQVESVLDPTFLIDSTAWRELAIYSRTDTPFLFCYLLGNNISHQKWVNDIAQKLHLSVVCVTPHHIARREGWRCLHDIGPRQFLGLVQTAQYIITDSFHGMALAINLQKDFYVLERFTSTDPINQNSRIYNILQLLQLHDRLLTAVPGEIVSVDYKKVNPLLEIQRTRSERILYSMLRQGTRRS